MKDPRIAPRWNWPPGLVAVFAFFVPLGFLLIGDWLSRLFGKVFDTAALVGPLIGFAASLCVIWNTNAPTAGRVLWISVYTVGMGIFLMFSIFAYAMMRSYLG